MRDNDDEDANDEENDVHTNTNYDSIPYKICDICSKTFKYKSWLKRHKLTHEVGHIQCNYCPKSFKWCYNLKRHLITHLGRKSYDCQHCGKQFSYKYSLKYHIDSQHIEKVKKVCCPICQKKLSNHNVLRYHNNRVHSGVKPFICWCLMAFHAPNGLYRHHRKMVIQNKILKQQIDLLQFNLLGSLTDEAMKEVQFNLFNH